MSIKKIFCWKYYYQVYYIQTIMYKFIDIGLFLYSTIIKEKTRRREHEK